MALTVTEASAVNTLLRWLLHDADDNRERPTSERAKAAAVMLADHATKTLMAGLSGEDVAQLWPADRPSETVTPIGGLL